MWGLEYEGARRHNRERIPGEGAVGARVRDRTGHSRALGQLSPWWREKQEENWGVRLQRASWAMKLSMSLIPEAGTVARLEAGRATQEAQPRKGVGWAARSEVNKAAVSTQRRAAGQRGRRAEDRRRHRPYEARRETMNQADQGRLPSEGPQQPPAAGGEVVGCRLTISGTSGGSPGGDTVAPRRSSP